MKPISFFIGIVSIVGAAASASGGDLLEPRTGLDAADLYRGDGSPAGLILADDRLEALASLGPAPATGLASAVAPSTLGAEGDHSGSYFAARIGPLWFIEDLEDLDVGFNAEVAFGFRPISLLAFEFQSGYLWGETDGSLDAEIWGIPFLVNAKLIIPVLILEVYAGVGFGGYYIDTEASTVGLSDSEEDIVFGGNAFVGAGFVLGPFAVGVEGKYIQTDDFDAPGGSEAKLQGFAAMAYMTFYF
jgi:hypothetical protein